MTDAGLTRQAIADHLVYILVKSFYGDYRNVRICIIEHDGWINTTTGEYIMACTHGKKCRGGFWGKSACELVFVEDEVFEFPFGDKSIITNIDEFSDEKKVWVVNKLHSAFFYRDTTIHNHKFKLPGCPGDVFVDVSMDNLIVIYVRTTTDIDSVVFDVDGVETSRIAENPSYRTVGADFSIRTNGDLLEDAVITKLSDTPLRRIGLRGAVVGSLIAGEPIFFSELEGFGWYDEGQYTS